MGYIDKENVTDSIISAIRTVLRGEIYLSTAMSTLLSRLVTGGDEPHWAPVDKLSDRELERISLIGHGLNTAALPKNWFLVLEQSRLIGPGSKKNLGFVI